MASRYYVDRLFPSCADAIAKIEKLVHPEDHRIGREVIWAQLEETECEGENLSLGLYYGTKLVGYLLLFVLQERRKICDYFGVGLPKHMEPAEPVMYAADIGVLPDHRHQIRLLNLHLSTLLRARPDLWSLPMEAFATEALTKFWKARARVMSNLGWLLQSQFPFDDPRLKQPMYWLHFEPCRQPKQNFPKSQLNRVRDFTFFGDKISIGVARSIDEWAAIEPYWENLLQRTKQSTVLQSYIFLRTWWSHFEFSGEPFIVVALRDGQPIAISPLQITPVRRFSSAYRCLTTIGEFTSDAGLLIAPEAPDNHIQNAIAAYICAEDECWDYISFTGYSDSTFINLLNKKIKSSGHFTSINIRKSAQQSLPVNDDLEDLGRAQSISCQNKIAAELALSDYLSIEQAHPLANKLEFRLPHRAIVSFWRDLVRNCCASMQLSVIYWRLDDKVVSACLGLIWNDVFYPLRSLPNSTQRRILEIPLNYVNARPETAKDLIILKASHQDFKGLLAHLRSSIGRTSVVHAIERLFTLVFGSKEYSAVGRTVHTFQMLKW